MFLDRLDGGGAALGFADHGDQAGGAEHHLGELVHAGGGGGAGRAHGLVTHRVDRTDVVNHAVGEVHGQLLALGQHVLDALVRRIAAGEHLAVEQQGVARLPAGYLGLGERVEVDALAFLRVRRPAHVGPQVQRGRIQVHRARAVHDEVGVARGRAIGDHRHRLAGGVGGIQLDLDVQHRGQAAQALGANAQGVDLVMQLQAQLFHLGQLLAASGLGLQLVHVDVVHQTFLGHQRRFFGGATDADTQHARGAPTRAHGGHGLEHPVHHAVAGVEHDHLGFVLAATAFGRHGDLQLIAGHDLGEDDGGGVVLGVLAQKLGVIDHRGAQHVVRVVVAAAHAFVDRVFQRALEALEAHAHAHLQEYVDDAGVLADGAVAHGAHLAVGQDLCDGILGGRRLLALVGTGQVGDVVAGVVVADVLQGSSDGFDQVVLADGGHVGERAGRKRDGTRNPQILGKKPACLPGGPGQAPLRQ